MKVGDKVKIKEVHTRPDGNEGTDLCAGKEGTIIQMVEDTFQGEKLKRCLIRAVGLRGATEVTGYCEHCQRNITERLPNHRWMYDFALEKVGD
jgi:hypothetical protein